MEEEPCHSQSYLSHGFECYICSFILPSQSTLRYHLVQVHQINATNSILCILCNYEYWNNDQQLHHLKTKHGIKKINSFCNICRQEFSSKIECLSHQKKHPLKFACYNCPKKFPSIFHLTTHCQEHLSIAKSHICSICGIRFCNLRTLIFHNWRHKSQICLKCKPNLEFDDESFFFAHLHIIHNVCGSKFNNLSILRDKNDHELDQLITQYRKSFSDNSNNKHENIKQLDFECIHNISIKTLMELNEIELGKITISEFEFLKIKTNLLELLRDRPKILKLTKDESSLSSLEFIYYCLKKKDNQCMFCTPFSNKKNNPHSKKEIYSCYICSHTFSSLRLLYKHVHHASCSNDVKKVIICEDCNKLFATSSSLLKHQKLFHNNPAGRYKCKKCRKNFQSKSYLNDHLFKIHKVLLRQRNYHCKVCSKTFTSAKFLSKHEGMHKDELEINDSESFLCDVCDKKFINKSKYLRHLQNHEITHVCSYCDTTFSSLSRLSSHMVIHNKEMKTRFSCNKCPLKFYYKSQLQVHLKTHTNEKPFVCTVCGKAFKRLQHRKNHHLLVHSDAKIDCPECDKKFGTEANLMRHRIVFHYNLRRWVCGVCSQNYGYSQDLRTHLMKKHEVKFDTIENTQKKSIFEVYIIPELGSYDLSESDRFKITTVFNEEKAKLTNLQMMLTSNNQKDQIALVKPVTNQEIATRVVIDAKSGEEAFTCPTQNSNLSSMAKSQPLECVLYNSMPLANSTLCKPSMPSNASVASTIFTFQCSMCSNVFSSASLCETHIMKTHFSSEAAYLHHSKKKNSVLQQNISITGNYSPLPIALIPQQISSFEVAKIASFFGPLEATYIVEDSSTFSKNGHAQVVQLQYPAGSSIAQPIINPIILHNDSSKPASMPLSLYQESCSATITPFPSSNLALATNKGLKKEGRIDYGPITVNPVRVSASNSIKILNQETQILDQTKTQTILNSTASDANLLLTLASSNPSISGDDALLINSTSSLSLKSLQDQNSSNLSCLQSNHPQELNDRPFFISDQISLVSDSMNKTLEYNKLHVVNDEACAYIEVSEEKSNITLAKDFDIDTMAKSSTSCSLLGTQFIKEKSLEIIQNKDPLNELGSKSNARQTNEESLLCDICKKKFTSILKLRRHMRIHQKAKYICQFCDKSFVEKFNLKTHLLVHTSEKPLECDRCDRKFRYHRDLKDHKNSHAKTYSYSCNACNLSFLRQKDFARHNKEQHTEHRFKCKYCAKSFKRKDYLDKVHMMCHTKEFSGVE